MKCYFSRLTLMLVTALTVFDAHAAAGAGTKILGGDFSYNGVIRLETAISTNGHAAEANQFGNPANGIPINRVAGNPLLGYTVPLLPGSPFLAGVGLPGGFVDGVSNNTIVTDTSTRYVPKKSPIINYHVLRFEATPTIAWGSYSFVSRIRALYDPGSLGYKDFDARDYERINGGIDGGVPAAYHGTPSYFDFPVEGQGNPLFFERSGKNYMVDLPAFFGQWTNGQTTIRVGNQSVAWGQLLFFRVMDVANGLDLRRHLIIDRVLEEYADERMSSPGIRITHQINDELMADAFVSQFIPTILTNPNTPYNVIPTQFTLHDRWHEGGYDQKLNYGIRIKGEFGNYNLQAMATRRYNPLGAIRWSRSGVNKALPNSNALGLVFNQYCAGILLAMGQQANNGCGPLLAETPFEASPAGVFTAEEWFNYGGYIKLDNLDGLDSVVNEFPAARLLLAQTVNHNSVADNNEVDTFFMAGEGLRGHIERLYHIENVFGLGGGYVVEAEPGSILDQLIINVEATYTPKRTFTSVDLRQDFDKQSETQIGLVAEKYQRFSSEFPATYLVLQYLWQQNSDLFGLKLDGYGSENFSDQGVKLNKRIPTSSDPKINPGLGSANYVVLAALQPLPAYIWELSAAMLVDVQGGVLIQPGVQYKPRGNMTVNLFYNYVNGHAWGGNPNKNVVNLIDHADELGIRVGYQF